MIPSNINTPLDCLYTAIGVNTLVWGAINTAISIPFLLGIPREHAAALRDESLGYSELLQRREAAIQRAHTQATVFALNTGLDVAYITAGTLVLVLAANNIGPRPWLEGIGVAAISQGAFLFAFDLAGWIMSNQRASAITAVNPVL